LALFIFAPLRFLPERSSCYGMIRTTPEDSPLS
jgi:hypothetical protein